MLHPRRRAFVATGLLVAAVALAGCAAEEGEVAATICEFVSIEYENALDRTQLRPALEGEGYQWYDQEDGIAVAVPPAPQSDYVRVVFADPSLSSGGGSVISVTETGEFADVPAGEGRVGAVAQDVSGIVNATFAPDEAAIEQWIDGEHQECPSSDATTVSAAFMREGGGETA